MQKPPDRKPPHRKQVERRRAVRGPTGTGSKEWVATGCAGIDVHGQRGTNRHGQRRDKRRQAGMGRTRMDGHEAKRRASTGQRDGRSRQQGVGRRGQHGAGRRQHGNGRCGEAPAPKTKGPLRRGGTGHRNGRPPTPGGRSGGTERQPFLIEAISWAGVACR